MGLQALRMRLDCVEQATTVGVKSGICQGLPGGRASKLRLEDGGAFGHLVKDKGSLKGTVGARTSGLRFITLSILLTP